MRARKDEHPRAGKVEHPRAGKVEQRAGKVEQRAGKAEYLGQRVRLSTWGRRTRASKKICMPPRRRKIKVDSSKSFWML
jgi:hypothetical protein